MKLFLGWSVSYVFMGEIGHDIHSGEGWLGPDLFWKGRVYNAPPRTKLLPSSSYSIKYINMIKMR
jgi:hypothetical protein